MSHPCHFRMPMVRHGSSHCPRLDSRARTGFSSMWRTTLTATALSQVRRIASDVFGIPEERIEAGSSPETLEHWDSIQHLNFVLALEEQFGFQLSPEEMDDMRTIGRAAHILEHRLQVSTKDH